MGLSIAICPSTPLLVPRLAGAAAAQTEDMRVAAFAAVRPLPARWLVIGTAHAAATYGPEAAGTFAGYGVDIPVALSSNPSAVIDLPLSALIAGWLRGQINPDGTIEVCVLRADGDGWNTGRSLRAHVESEDHDTGILVIADGANTLTEKAPGGYRPEAGRAQHALTDALTRGVSDGLLELSDLIIGAAAYEALAGLVGADHVEAQCLYQGAPYGVGYTVASWRCS